MHLTKAIRRLDTARTNVTFGLRTKENEAFRLRIEANACYRFLQRPSTLIFVNFQFVKRAEKTVTVTTRTLANGGHATSCNIDWGKKKRRVSTEADLSRLPSARPWWGFSRNGRWRAIATGRRPATDIATAPRKNYQTPIYLLRTNVTSSAAFEKTMKRSRGGVGFHYGRLVFNALQKLIICPV